MQTTLNFDLDSTYQINQEQVENYKQNGFIVLPKVATSEEVDYYRYAISDAVEQLNTEKRDMKERDTYAKAFLQIMNLWLQDQKVKQLLITNK